MTVIVSVQATIEPLTYNELAVNWVQSLFQVHCQPTSKEAEECFQQCEQDIIDMVGNESYSRFLEHYTTLLHAKLGNKLTCGLRTCLPGGNLTTSKASARTGVGVRMVSLESTLTYFPDNTIFVNLDCWICSVYALVVFTVQGGYILLFIAFLYYSMPQCPVLTPTYIRNSELYYCLSVCI